MPKIAHTMAIPPGFPAYRRRDMRAKKSSKNLLRISGLALVFMLAVALLVSAISFTRVGAGDNKTAFAAVTKEPSIKELAIDASDWKWNVPFKEDADGNIAVFSYRPSTYKNYFAWIGGVYTDISGRKLTDTYASIAPRATGSIRERLFAYYKLPDVLTTLGATIEVSANLDSAVKFTRMKEERTFISVAGNISKIEENEDKDGVTAEQVVEETYNSGTTWKVTANRQYILVYAGGQEDRGAFEGSEKIEISGLEITIKVKSVDNPSLFTPVTAAWDGKTKPDIAVLDTIANISNLYTANNNIVGNLDWALNGEDVLDPTFNKLTSIRTDGTQTKQFSFLLFDKFFGLKEADIKGFNILQAYSGTGAIVDGSAKTYKRSDYTLEQLKTLRYPTGLESITVQPFAFDNNDPATGSFRGLYVTVKYDGKDNNALPIETDTIYRVNYKNSINLSGKTLSIDCDGIDYTKPTALDEVALLTESVVNEKDGVTYFYTDTIKFKPVLEDDDTRGDVKYFYTLYKKVDGNYVEIAGQTGIAINNPGSDIFTLSGLEKGEYAIKFKAIDTVGLFYENLVKDKTPEQIEGLNLNDVQKNWANHAVYSDYHYFTIDDIKNPPEKWETAIYLENGGAYNGKWTNQNVVIEFNTLSSIMEITYQISYRTLKNGVFVGTQTEWVSINDKIIDNKFIIGNDETSPEGYERIYYLQAIYNSSNITYTVNVPVKYDNYNGYKPEIARLLDFSTDAYADLLPLLVNLNYKQVGKEGYVSEFLGSPMTLYYAITRDGVKGAAKELSLDTNNVYMDLFEGRNVSGLTQIQVRFWLTDEAGNTNNETIYNVNLDRAKINVNFHIDTNARRYFNNTTDVNTSLVSYTLSNKFAGTIPSGKIGITFDAAYDDVNAGIRQVIVSNVLASYVEGSAYTAALIDEYEKVFFDVNGNVITLVDGKFVVGTHEIRKARLTIDKDYKHAPFVYNGTINYAMTDYVSGDGSLLVLDKVLGDKADEWKNIQWKGTIQLDSIAVNNNLRASLINIEIAGELGNNYQITDAGGNASAPKTYIDILPAKLGKITLIASKVYNGENTILTNSVNCKFQIAGLQGTDNITLEYGTITLPGKDVGTYTFNVNDFKLVGERQKFYDLTDVTVEATVNVTPKTITVTVHNVEKPFDNKTAFQIGNYTFGGVVTGDDVKLLTSTGNTANINVGTYPDCKVTLGITGNDSKNYVLKDTEAVVTVTISPREIGGAKITGIYAVDTNGNYYYINETGGNVVIYQKDGAGYIAYSKDENGKAKAENVDVLPAGATVWVLDTFVTGGVCIINGHRFELSQDIVYAIEYYEDTGLKNKLDIGEIDFKERQYQPVVVDQNGKTFIINVDIKDGVYDTTSGAYKYTLKIENFGAKSNFKKITGFNDTETKVVSVLDFSDVKFENKMFNDKGNVDKFSAPYNAAAYTLNVISPSQLNIELAEYFKKGADGVWMPVENAIDAGVYYGKFTVSRLNNEYIIEQAFTIERIGTEIKIKDASVTYDAKYGEDFAEKVQKVDDAFNYYKTTYGMVVGANDIVYEYSFDEDFKTLLGSAPVRQGGGVCYVRVRYKGNENFIGSVSLARKINVNGAKFNLVDITANVGESFNLPTVENLIDKDSVGGNYKEIAKDFVIVYRVSDASYKVVNNAAGLVGEGRYPYRVVHKGLIKGGKWEVDNSAESERYTRAVSADGIIEATISIIENELNSVWGGDVNVPDDKVLEDNGIGTISGSWTQADSGYTVYFCILDRNNAASRDNFTNGLRQNKEIFGKEYAAGKVYFLSLSEYKNKSVLMNADKQPRLMSPATVTMQVSANGAKLIRYNNGEWTEVNYVDNGDGTVTFETDKLGYFIFTEDYVAPKAKTNTLAIGIGAGVGGAAVLMAIIVVTVVVIKKKRI